MLVNVPIFSCGDQCLIQTYVIKFGSDMLPVCGFLRRYIEFLQQQQTDDHEILLKVALNTYTNGHFRMSGLIPDQCDPRLSLAYFFKFTCAPSFYT